MTTPTTPAGRALLERDEPRTAATRRLMKRLGLGPAWLPDFAAIEEEARADLRAALQQSFIDHLDDLCDCGRPDSCLKLADILAAGGLDQVAAATPPAPLAQPPSSGGMDER
jgi:hypothetical protein